MIFQKWLTINSKGSARITQGRPSTGYDEISILLRFDIPKELFERPKLVANVRIPAEAVRQEVITAEIVDNIESVIKSSIGMDLKVSVVDPHTDEQD
jgi:hypothetical protein